MYNKKKRDEIKILYACCVYLQGYNAFNLNDTNWFMLLIKKLLKAQE